jgi:leucyl aminopeptidase (aminopeptidase T)
MGLASRRALVQKLRARQARIANHSPNKFAAYQMVKHLTTTSAEGVKPRTASVFFDKSNARLGNALVSEFSRRGIRTSGIGVIDSDAKTKMNLRGVQRQARADAVVFVARDKGQAHERLWGSLIDQAEARSKTRVGTRLVDAYGMKNAATRRTLALTAQQQRAMRAFSQKTFDAVKGSKRIVVKSPNGTNLVFDLSSRIRWLQDRGVISKNYWGNLPAGEVWTSPLRVNGTFVIDGFAYGLGNLKATPVRGIIKDSRVVLSSVSCASLAVREKFIQQLKSDKNSSRVGELGLGTNVAIKKETGIILTDEKIPGVHIAFGDPLSHDSGARWASEQHNDGVIRNPTIIVDGRTIMREGKSLLR